MSTSTSGEMGPTLLKDAPGPFTPTVIIHGGAGSISRASLPPELYVRYHASLLSYLTATRRLLDSGVSALDAACEAVRSLEDDPLFNCGRGSVFTEQGTIEMEASVMVCSVDPAGPRAGGIKRAAAVSLVRNTRHPILLAKEVLLSADQDAGLGGTSTMHAHLSGRDVEQWGWTERHLEKKPQHWFWTKKRWEEHRRGLGRTDLYTFDDLLASANGRAAMSDGMDGLEIRQLPSQGTVGAVCLDSWGNVAVATSTGGLTNKKAGRIGDTPTVGAGFWAEAWEENVTSGVAQDRTASTRATGTSLFEHALIQATTAIGSCFPLFDDEQHHPRPIDAPPPYTEVTRSNCEPYLSLPSILPLPSPSTYKHRRAVAMSGTGNGDSFLRTNAVRTAASICRFSTPAYVSLAEAVTAVAGPGGELQRSAGDRWGRTGEGQGGIIGIEIVDDGAGPPTQSPGWNDESKSWGKTENTKKRGRAVFDFNCTGLFRAYYDVEQGGTGEETPKVMVFKDEY